MKALARFVPDCLVLFRRLLGDARVSRPRKLLLIATVGYLAFPLDLIPDFIPVLGQLDDILLVPAGFYLVWRMIPQEVWREAQERAQRNG